MRSVRWTMMMLGVGLLAACVPPTSPEASWTRATPNYAGRYTTPRISGDGETVVSRIDGTSRVAVDRLATREHLTFSLPGLSYVAQLSHDGRYVAYTVFDFAGFTVTHRRLDTETGAVVDVGRANEWPEFSGDLQVAASVVPCATSASCNATLVTWTESGGVVERELPIRISSVSSRLDRDGSTLRFIATTFQDDDSTAIEVWEVDVATGAARLLDVPLPAGAHGVWPRWWSEDGAVVRADVLLDLTGFETRTYELGVGASPEEITPCSGTYSSNGRYCAELRQALPAWTRSLHVTDFDTGAERRIVADDAETHGPKVDTLGTVGDNGRVAFGFHSDLEADWPVYIVGGS